LLDESQISLLRCVWKSFLPTFLFHIRPSKPIKWGF
jgi:hypothetical protein